MRLVHRSIWPWSGSGALRGSGASRRSRQRFHRLSALQLYRFWFWHKSRAKSPIGILHMLQEAKELEKVDSSVVEIHCYWGGCSFLIRSPWGSDPWKIVRRWGQKSTASRRLKSNASTIPGKFVSIHQIQWSNMIQHDPTKFQQDSTDDSQDWYFKCLHDSGSLCKKHGKAVMPDCFCYFWLVSSSCMSASCSLQEQWPDIVDLPKNSASVLANIGCQSCRTGKPESQNFQLCRKWAFLRENIRRIVNLLKLG